MRVSHRFTAGSARFDEDNLVSPAGLVPLLGLAEQTGLPNIIAGKVSITTPRIKSGSANPAPKLLGVIAGMCAGSDSIDDLDVLRAGGMPILFDGVYAPSTLGVLLREFSFGHARQLESVLREHLVTLAERTPLLAGLADQAFIDIDSLLRPVYGHAKQGASYGHTKIAGKQVLRKGLSPLATTISTEHSAPVIAGMRLRAGKPARARAPGAWSPKPSPPPGRPAPPGRSSSRRLGLRQPRGGPGLRARQGRVLLVIDRRTGAARRLAQGRLLPGVTPPPHGGLGADLLAEQPVCVLASAGEAPAAADLAARSARPFASAARHRRRSRWSAALLKTIYVFPARSTRRPCVPVSYGRLNLTPVRRCRDDRGAERVRTGTCRGGGNDGAPGG